MHPIRTHNIYSHIYNNFEIDQFETWLPSCIDTMGSQDYKATWTFPCMEGKNCCMHFTLYYHNPHNVIHFFYCNLTTHVWVYCALNMINSLAYNSDRFVTSTSLNSIDWFCHSEHTLSGVWLILLSPSYELKLRHHKTSNVPVISKCWPNL